MQQAQKEQNFNRALGKIKNRNRQKLEAEDEEGLEEDYALMEKQLEKTRRLRLKEKQSAESSITNALNQIKKEQEGRQERPAGD